MAASSHKTRQYAMIRTRHPTIHEMPKLQYAAYPSDFKHQPEYAACRSDIAKLLRHMRATGQRGLARLLYKRMKQAERELAAHVLRIVS
jgi:hypothetical protein